MRTVGVLPRVRAGGVVRRVRTAVLLLALPTAAAACRGGAPPPSDPSLELRVRVAPTPAHVGPGRVLIALSDTGGRPVSGARFRVTGRMSHAGMVPVVDTAVEEEPGRYAVPGFDFDMAGSWLLEVRGVLPDGREVAVDQPIQVVGGPR